MEQPSLVRVPAHWSSHLLREYHPTGAAIYCESTSPLEQPQPGRAPDNKSSQSEREHQVTRAAKLEESTNLPEQPKLGRAPYFMSSHFYRECHERRAAGQSEMSNQRNGERQNTRAARQYESPTQLKQPLSARAPRNQSSQDLRERHFMGAAKNREGTILCEQPRIARGP